MQHSGSSLLSKFITSNSSITFKAMYSINTSIQLSPIETKICNLLNDYILHYNNSNRNKDPLVLRITGGWVRDKLLNQSSHDLDIAINTMSGEQFATNLNEFLAINYSNYNIKPHTIHKINKNPEKSKHLETTTTKLFDIEVDFVNLRSEEYSDDSRIPVTKFGTPEQDALRRDATLNALFYNIQSKQIEDFTKTGLKDLEDGILRTPLPPRQTFLDDPLRVLRLIRFASRFNFKIDPATLQEMNDIDINNAFISKISRERIGIEFEKILKGTSPLIGISLIQSTNIDNVIFFWQNDDSIIEFNKLNNPDIEKIDKIYKYDQKSRSILNNHILKLITLIPIFLQRFPECQIKFNDSKNIFFKKCFYLSSILIPMSNLKIIFNPKKKLNNTCPLVESIIKDGLKFPKLEAVTSSLIVESLNEYHNLVLYLTSNKSSIKRSIIGSFLRKLNGNWEICHFVSALNQMLLNPDDSEIIIENYKDFYNFVFKNSLENSHNLKPLVDGKELLKLFSLKGGPWLGKINDEAIIWQLDHPEANKDDLLDHIKLILPDYV
ncbi:hypothetical protein TBLA_0E04200 [Henningerozyma blattae CBS 6284]|uniref:CCA tRNA nucleotidyltransferase, mitochondrial n=1 Tax=Henningerozyma blattae (strain ATCC 34711 / CBS 6284 / DSM 70876 / NBRC 10599 / NRRL Y-10934 / UCD 77-7) TaxID=1071380 RepID=I2H522_HENB6|nr:hypothetical protein TBLA_0E04200 [Tetrapisispora blattae CBS 6284]CCH61474.1 hypothetical protein TBLA_0E04200 [Tetrapisispora blattae CBS 6284]